jgi:hypothetical protein
LFGPAVPARRRYPRLQRFMVNGLLRTAVIGLESHPDRVVSADDDPP